MGSLRETINSTLDQIFTNIERRELADLREGSDKNPDAPLTMDALNKQVEQLET